jgi:hypothetical protein
MRRGQQGLTLIGFVMVLAVAGCVAYLAMRVVPMYLEYMQVVKAMEGVAQEPGIETMDPDRIHNLIGRRFNIGYVETVDNHDVKIIRDPNGMRLSVAYDVRKPVVSNIDLIAHFEKTVNVGGKTSANAP